MAELDDDDDEQEQEKRKKVLLYTTLRMVEHIYLLPMNMCSEWVGVGSC